MAEAMRDRPILVKNGDEIEVRGPLFCERIERRLHVFSDRKNVLAVLHRRRDEDRAMTIYSTNMRRFVAAIFHVCDVF